MAEAKSGVKLGVSGVAQFKQGIKEAQSAVKTLDAQLKLNEAQFRQTGDAEEYMQGKTDLLNKQIEAQKKVIEQTEKALEAMKNNGVKETSAAWQQMQQQLANAKTSLTNMQTDLQNVGNDADTASDNVSEMNSQLQRIGEGVTFQNVTKGIDSITTKLENAAKKAISFGKQIVNLTLDAGQWADELITDSKVYGMTPEELQRARKTSQIIDTTVEAIVSAKKKMNKGLGSGSDEVMGTFAAFGLDPATLATTEDKFWAIGDAIYHMTDAEEQEVYAQRVFGRSWAELNPLFEAGREEYEKTNAAWSVVSDENLEKLGKMDDEYQRLQSEWESFQMTVLSTLAEALTPILETLTGLLQQLNEYLSSEEGQQMLEEMGQAIKGLFEDITNIDPQQVIESFKGAFDSIVGGLKWLWEHREDLVTALEAIVGGWALLKITGGALQLLELVNGLRWLSGKPAINLPFGEKSSGNDTGGWNLGNILNVAVLTAAAKAVSDATYKPIMDTWNEFENATAGMSNEAKSRFAGAQTLGLSLEEYDKLMGYNAPKALPEGGTAYVAVTGPTIRRNRFTGEVEGEYDLAMDRMSRIAEMIGESTAKTAANSLTSADISAFTGLPAAIAQAVENANISVYIDGELASNALSPRVSEFVGRAVTAMVR